MSIFIVAEIGINHNGKYDLAEKLIVESAKVDLNVKIGGCEAKNDIFFCKKIKTNSIVAPMVESEYALRKFIQCASI